MRIHGSGRRSRVQRGWQHEVGSHLRHEGSLQLMNSLKGCLLVAAVGPEFGSGNLVGIIVFLRHLLVQLVLTFGHASGAL
jgi:hypothetical protein